MIAVLENEVEELIKEYPGAEKVIRREIEGWQRYYITSPFQEKEKKIFLQCIKKLVTFINQDYKEDKEIKETKKKKRDLDIVYDSELNSLEINQVEWIIEGIIPEKSISFLAGKRGVFKSFISLLISYCVSNGLAVFNKFSSKKSKILYLDEENGLPLIKGRADKIKNGLDIQNNSDVAYSSFAGLKFDSPSSMTALEKVIQEFKPKIVIVDSYRRFVGFDENDAGKVSSLFTDILRPLSEKYGVSWILVHHLRKGMAGRNPIDDMDEIRGSSDLANYADTILIVQRNRGAENNFILKQAKCRYKQEMAPKAINIDWGEDILTMDCVGDAEENIYAVEVCANMIMKWAAETEKTSFNRMEALDAMKSQKQSKPTVERALRMLLDNQKLIKPKRGIYELNPDYKKEEKKASEPQKPLDAFEAKEDKTSEASNYNIEVIKIDGTDFVKVT